MATAPRAVLEPRLTDQWYVDAKTLAQPALAAVREGRTTFVPKNWEKTYFDWLENIQPWCVSRQLWWGHRIPAWYDDDGNVFVEESEEAALAAARAKHRRRCGADARRGRARHLVLLRAVALLDARLAGRDAGARALLSDERAGHRLRHHLLLGRPHDDDGPPFQKGGPLPRRLHPRPRPRREGREDVEVEGQCHRPAASHRRLWRRRAALHAGRDGGAGARHQALDAARRRLSQFRDEAVERLALRRDERLRARRGLRSARQSDHAQPLDRRRGGAHGART